MKKKFFLGMVLIFLTSISIVNVYGSSFLNKIIQKGNNFESGGSSGDLGNVLSNFISGDVLQIVRLIGNLIFAAVTVILGAKYIWSSAEGKSEVMESLPAFVVAVVFFYLGGNLVTWLNDATSGVAGANSWRTLSGRIRWIVNTVVGYAAFGGILFLGLKYMFASAEGKSKLKTNMGGLVLGMVFVFLASQVVDFIIQIGDSII